MAGQRISQHSNITFSLECVFCVNFADRGHGALPNVVLVIKVSDLHFTQFYPILHEKPEPGQDSDMTAEDRLQSVGRQINPIYDSALSSEQ